MEGLGTSFLAVSIIGSDQSDGEISHELIDEVVADIVHAVEAYGGSITGPLAQDLVAAIDSTDDALRCALDIQSKINNERGLEVRLGIHTLDGTPNDAADVTRNVRDQADASQIRISKAALDKLDDAQDYEADDQMEIGTGDIESSIETFSIKRNDARQNSNVRTSGTKHAWRTGALAAGLALVLLVAAFSMWQGPFGYDFEPADIEKFEFALPEKPSIAVLPFDNLSSDPANDYLGDGLTENIIAVLATSPELFVIARNSVFTYKDKPTKVQEVAEQLGVRYVMEGSIQVEGEKMRVVAQLVDALDGKHLWAERYDYEPTDIFKLQDDLTYRILEQLEIRLTLGQQAIAWIDNVRGLPNRLEFYRRFIEGRRSFQRWDIEGHQIASRLWGEIYEMWPNEWGPQVLMGWLHQQKIMVGLSVNVPESLARSREFADRALDLFGDGQTPPEIHNLFATLDKMELKHESALMHAEEALRLRPGSSVANTNTGWIKLKSDQVEEGIVLLRRAMRLEPSYSFVPLSELALGLIMIGDYGEAKAINAEILAKDAPFFFRKTAFQQLAVISIFENNLSAAREYASQMLAISPNENTKTQYATWFYDFTDQDFVKRYLDASQRAGIPENPPNSDG